MYCQNCGTQFEGNFCPACGTPKGANARVMTQPESSGTPNPSGNTYTPITKKWWFWVLIAVTLLALFLTSQMLASDSKRSEGSLAVQETEEAQVQEPAAATEVQPAEGQVANPLGQKDAAAEALSIEETVLLDQDGIRVVATGLSQDGWMGPEINILVENSTDRAITVQVREVSVNGAMMTPILSCDVAAGKKANDAISFYQTDLDTAGISTLQTIELKFTAFDSESWDTILDSEAITLHTNAPDQTQIFNDSGFVALDQDGLRVVMRGVSEESLWGKDISVYLENHTGHDVTVQLRDPSVNGFMMEPYFSCEVIDGKVAYSTISFMSENLEENGIDTIDTLECGFIALDLDTWDTIFESDPVTIAFPF